MPTAKKPTTLAAALLQAQQDLEAVPKDARNEHHRYDYVSAETMIEKCREVLHKHGLVLTAASVELVPFAATEHGDAVLVNHGFRLCFNDEVIELVRGWPAIPGRGRPLDKAVAGALTACLSYTLRDLLLIPRGDEPGVGMDDTARDTQPKAHTEYRDRTPMNHEPPARAQPQSVAALVGGDPSCPSCGSRLYDNRNDPNRKPKAPLWKCANKDCKGGRNDWPWASWDEWPHEFGNPPAPDQPEPQAAPELDEIPV